MRRLAALIVALLALTLIAPTATAHPRPTGHRTHEGTIDGARFLVKVPYRWNGTLVQFSHGYYLAAWPPDRTWLAASPQSEQWLLDQGYALAASDYANPFGYAVEDALTDQVALLDWFREHVGTPRRTLSNGFSMGGGIAILLAERHPRRYDGVLTTCSEFDLNGTWNSGLDVNFATRTLLTDDDTIELVRAADPETATRLLTEALTAARGDAAGRAKLALIAALANVPGWASAHEPAPTDLDTRIQRMADWLTGAYTQGIGPGGRVDLEARAGGNPSWNVGVDYARLLARSGQRDVVRQAYAKAGLDVRADLAELAAAPRIAPDARALAYMYRFGVPKATNPVPMLNLHTTHDGGSVSDQAGWYADQVDRYGDPRKLRQSYLNRGNHCAFSPAEELTALRAVERRVETGRWPDTRPSALNRTAGGFGPGFHDVLDLFTGEVRPSRPAFVDFTPSPFLRPSR